MTTEDQANATWRTNDLPLLGGAVLLLGVLTWLYWDPVAVLVGRWINDADYQYGFLVPVFAGFLLWHRREMKPSLPLKGSRWGMAFLALAAVMFWGSTYLLLALPKPLSLVPCLAGATLLIGGWRTLRWAWPSIVFLAFMVPLPGFLGGLLSQPLQRVGTIAGTAVIQTVGIPAAARGNVILLPETEIGVVEACNGLRMLMLFFTVSVGFAFLVQRTWYEKVIIVISALPIAVLANVARISVTAGLHEIANSELAHAVFHDVAGWFMMPLAILMLWMLSTILSKVLVAVDESGPVAIAVHGGRIASQDRPHEKSPKHAKRPGAAVLVGGPSHSKARGGNR